jgi:hypothetical protein
VRFAGECLVRDDGHALCRWSRRSS